MGILLHCNLHGIKGKGKEVPDFWFRVSRFPVKKFRRGFTRMTPIRRKIFHRDRGNERDLQKEIIPCITFIPVKTCLFLSASSA